MELCKNNETTVKKFYAKKYKKNDKDKNQRKIYEEEKVLRKNTKKR